MKAMPTLEGGLRVDTENADEWQLLKSILADANAPATDLASRLGELMHDDAGSEDWQEFVVPDLRETFQDALAHVGAAVEAAMFHAEYGPGPMWITRDDADHWYGSLNQARLALEEQFHFGPSETVDLKQMPPESRSAWMRTNFYQTLQGMLLEHAMK
jgi:hypothetical protein